MDQFTELVHSWPKAASHGLKANCKGIIILTLPKACRFATGMETETQPRHSATAEDMVLRM